MSLQKGKILNWIIFAVLILILFGFLIYYQSTKKVVETVPEVRPEVETKITQPRKSFAVPEYTEDQKLSMDKDAYNQALLNGKGCENIKFDEKLKQMCFDTLAFNDALSKNDEKLCEQIVDEKMKTKCFDQIYLSLAIRGSDKTLCEKISDEATKKSCTDQILALSGIVVKSADECKVISDMSLKQKCLNNFYFENSITNLDKNGCNQIADPALKERCLNTITKSIEISEASKTQAVRTYQTTEEKLQTCDSLTGDSATSCKNESNYSLAGEKKDITYCNKITDSDLKTNCVQTQSTSINNYYLKQAIRLKDSSLCNKILDSGLRTTCISSM
jgi:hypothetical protein